MQRLHTLISPFAHAGAILLGIFAVTEFVRPGFVSLFLDLRIVAGATLALWAAAVLTDGAPSRRKWPSVVVVIAIVFSLIILYKLTAPYGRLGTIVLVGGVISMIIVFLSSINKNNEL